MAKGFTQPHGGYRSTVCRKKGCGFPLVTVTINDRPWRKCTGCERTAAGLCLDCPVPRGEPDHPRRLRCPACWRAHTRKLERLAQRMRYAEDPKAFKRWRRKYRRRNRKRIAKAAREARAAERAKGPPTPIDRLYWREKTKRWRHTMTPEKREAYLKRRCELRAAKKFKSLEVAA